MAVVAFANAMRVQSIIGNTALLIESELFGRPVHLRERFDTFSTQPVKMIAKAIGADWKGWLTLAAYVAAMPLAFVGAWISFSLYLAVAVIWLIPNRRIEATILKRADGEV